MSSAAAPLDAPRSPDPGAVHAAHASPADDAEVPRAHFLVGAASVLVSGLLSISWLWISVCVLLMGIASIAAALTGVLLIILWVLAMRVAAAGERRRARAVHGVDAVVPSRRVSTSRGFGGRLQNLALDLISWSFWRSVLHHHLTMLIAFVPCTVFFLGLWWAWTFGELALTLPDARLGGWQPGPLLLAIGSVLALAIALGALAAGVLAERGLARVMLPSTDDDLREEVAEMSVRRQGAVDAAEQERLRIERDLHDGVQPRLVALAMTLGMARSRITADPDGATELVGEAHEEAKAVITDLRQLARGIHPAVLTDRGLDPALSALAARSPIPVDLQVHVPGRIGREQEAVAYFVVAEALTNVAKHSGARSVRVDADVRHDPGPGRSVLHLRIADDGEGGATVRRDGVSTGLAGLTDRVRATGGQLDVTSPVGGPTVLEASIPLPGDTPHDEHSPKETTR
ncbi:sensor histidine kinase [Brachybacterium endophyticum]|uniref:histidine kinase n=1 Tax=Brachybacterium endophyticum TaxID=2182385 RepID=A0A2U2RM25_9MICO|nr:histidine kinase [Brachybacterium endophyticum]PWH06920.1 sensor histidine kinase [Brachybacterium endophyticum]